tara:strand:+ start:627 stop:806 length:180 start_codon:yes stop_codon:yes gene_type:complete
MAIKKAIPTARFLATYSARLNVNSVIPDPPKNDGFLIAMNGPINIGQINKKRLIKNNHE